MGFDFMVEYKPGVANQFADALSRMYKDGEKGFASTIGYEEHTRWVSARTMVVDFSQPLLCGYGIQIKSLATMRVHDTPSASHRGVKKMLVRLYALFYWHGMRKSVEDYIKQCRVCQQTKYSTQEMGGYLQPLPMPKGVWEDVYMDFITGLSLSKGFTAVLVVAGRFSKYAHFGALPTNFNGHKNGKYDRQVLVQWSGCSLEEATWCSSRSVIKALKSHTGTLLPARAAAKVVPKEPSTPRWSDEKWGNTKD
nr:hypothetical protein [Tanacetum cinerariifolium]